MSLLQVSAVLLNITALFLYINSRFLKLPTAVGLMMLSLVGAMSMAILQFLGLEFVGHFATRVVESIDLNEAVVHGFLCFLLFAGALHVDLENLLRERTVILLLATGGVLISTVVVGTLFFIITFLFGLDIPYLYCLVFGALISPTDAVTVLSFLKGTQVPASIESKITGESLLNDGMSIVLFLSLLGYATGTSTGTILMLPIDVLWDMGGGVLIGLVTGFVTSVYVKSVDNPYIEVVATLALATGSYVAGDTLGASGPIAVVVAGLFMGNRGKFFHSSDERIEHLDNFWNLIDEILSAILFVIMGLELLAISTEYSHLFLASIAIPIVLPARYISIKTIVRALGPSRSFSPHISSILTWSGLRGGVSIALVLSLPASEVRDVLMTATYFIVVFSVFVQGGTLRSFIKRKT